MHTVSARPGSASRSSVSRPESVTTNAMNAQSYEEGYPFGLSESMGKGPMGERLIKYSNYYASSDAIFKTIVASLDIFRLSYKSARGELKPYEYATTAREQFTVARNTWAILCSLQGSFHEWKDAAQSVARAIQSAYNSSQSDELFDSTTLLKQEERIAYRDKKGRAIYKRAEQLEMAADEKFPTSEAKVVGFVRRFFTMIEKGAQFIAYTFFQPFLLADTITKGEISESAKELGGQFNLFYMIYHMASLVGTGCDIVLVKFHAFSDKIVDHLMKLIVRIFDVIGDMAYYFQWGVNPLLLAILSFLSGSIGCVRLWLQVYA